MGVGAWRKATRGEGGYGEGGLNAVRVWWGGEEARKTMCHGVGLGSRRMVWMLL
jgi:hypothetical protein